MAVIEVQFRPELFFDLVKRRINLMPPPFSSVPEFQGLPSGLVDRWECTSVALATVSQTPDLDPLPPLAIRLTSSIAVSLTSYEEAKAAGSGNPPQTMPLQLTVFVLFAGGTGSALSVAVEKVLAEDIDVTAFAGGVAFDPVLRQSWGCNCGADLNRVGPRSDRNSPGY